MRSSFRVLNEAGEVVQGFDVSKELPDVTQDLAVKMYTYMVRLQIMDQVLYEVQRQGRISFYMTAAGEEGLSIGSSSALQPQDVIYAQYREHGVLMYKGFTLENIMDQCFATEDDVGKGRQMPVHYGSKALNYHTISSPLGTQIPQAAGAAYALKANQDNDAIVCCYFGEGAASEGDFHAALNFAATLECPVLFFCRNNGYAISTSTIDQYRGDGIIGRASGYGMASIRVDGNDILAVREATKQARKYILETNKPLLLEAMTYRQGHHSTSDDSTRYREIEEIEVWRNKHHPITRFKTFMTNNGWWDDEKEKELRKAERKSVLDHVKLAEQKAKPEAMENLFQDVYDEIPANLVAQQEELKQHVAKYPTHYSLDGH